MHTTSTPTAPERANGFAGLGLHEHLMRALRTLEFDTPTPVQRETIPAGVAGRDVLACASTGSGKTAAFLLPLLEQLRETPRGTTRALVLVPTRELAAQVVEHFRQLARHTQLRAAAVYGGVGMQPQEEAFRRGVDIIVATPGRLLDHMQYNYAHLSGIEHLVLDEADRMLDMGFLPAIRRVLTHLPRGKRQTLFFSATMPPQIAALARELLKDPVTINLERRATPATGITQALYPVPQQRKVDLLIELLRRGDVGNAIVFCRTKHRANRVAEKLERAGIAAERIHGNRSQAQRTKALAGFKDGTYRVLVATDIVARGIDVTALEHVVNFDVPNASEDYIHRVGRTARADATGDAYTLVAPDEEATMRDIERALGRRIDRRVVDGFDYDARTAEQLEVPLHERLRAARAARGGSAGSGSGRRKGSGSGSDGSDRSGTRGGRASGGGRAASASAGGDRSASASGDHSGNRNGSGNGTPDSSDPAARTKKGQPHRRRRGRRGGRGSRRGDEAPRRSA